MQSAKKVTAIILAALFLTVPVIKPTEVKAEWIPPEEWEFTPVVVGEITDQTKKVVVYSDGYEDVPVTLKISKDNQSIFKKTYRSRGIRVIEIPRQKAGTCLQFTLKTSYGRKGETVKKTVKKAGTVSKKKVSSKLSSPKVSGKVTDKSTSVKVYAKKGTTVYVKHGSKLLAKKKYKKSGYQILPIEKQKAGEVVTFFTEDKKGRSKYVEKVVVDATAPAKPKVEVIDSDIKVTGEIGTGVYIKDITDGYGDSWLFLEVLEKKNQVIYLWNYFLLDEPLEGADNVSIYQVRLVDAWGNKSKTVTVRIPAEEASELAE